MALYPDGRDDSALHVAVKEMERTGITFEPNVIDLLAHGGGTGLANVIFERSDEGKVVSLLEAADVEVVYED